MYVLYICIKEYEEGESKEKKPIYSVNTEKHAERELVDGNASWIKCKFTYMILSIFTCIAFAKAGLVVGPLGPSVRLQHFRMPSLCNL